MHIKITSDVGKYLCRNKFTAACVTNMVQTFSLLRYVLLGFAYLVGFIVGRVHIYMYRVRKRSVIPNAHLPRYVLHQSPPLCWN